MNTAELEKLILDHAYDFRTLLGPGVALAAWGKARLLGSDTGSGWIAGDDVANAAPILTPIALSALIESWRDRLEKEHGIVVAERLFNGLTEWICLRTNHDDGRTLAMAERGLWVPFLAGRGWNCWRSLIEVIVAAVHALAEEKRQKEKPMSGCGKTIADLWEEANHDMATFQALGAIEVGRRADAMAEEKRQAAKPTPSPAAVRAAERICGLPGNGPDCELEQGNAEDIANVAAIIDEEYRKANT